MVAGITHPKFCSRRKRTRPSARVGLPYAERFGRWAFARRRDRVLGHFAAPTRQAGAMGKSPVRARTPTYPDVASISPPLATQSLRLC